MEIDRTLVATLGLACWTLALVAFFLLRRVNRTLVALLATGFGCFALALGLMALEEYQGGIAHIPAGRRTTTEVTLAQTPTLFWIGTAVVWAGVLGLLSASIYLYRIALMRRRVRA